MGVLIFHAFSPETDISPVHRAASPYGSASGTRQEVRDNTSDRSVKRIGEASQPPRSTNLKSKSL
ncbi:hypothetical protein HMPREF1981_02891 [Bacteroides pyogenes F0041]|uniref:Uncharacterized protein n=1 Tax=Bacteroides pyogenes F0041 TaxID=1321819 RepID=U2CBC9_9BACE|nr:hypothetical protein HMPREF1981_02891 [Bacteroides pyogenes F0041]